MSGGRFGLLAGALGLVVAAASFVAALAVLDDGEPDPPPRSSGATDTTAVPIDTSSTTTTTTVAEGLLASPSWVAVVASAGTEIEAQQAAAAVATKRYPNGVLLSDDYPSLKAGLWVAYAGPYPDRVTAEAAVSALADDGIEGAYARCAGTVADCAGGGNGNGDDGDGDSDG